MKKKTALMMAAVLVLGLTACGKTVGDMDLEAGQSAIYIQEAGVVSYAVSETFDRDYYDKDDLEDKVKAEVEAYNNDSKASVSDALVLDTFKVKKDTATLVLEFATTYDFLTYVKDYNKIAEDQFYIGTIADNSACKIKGDFISPDQQKTSTGKEIKQMTDAYILIVNEEYRVQVDGTIHYISDNCKIDDNGIITTAKAEDGTSYIVYDND